MSAQQQLEGVWSAEVRALVSEHMREGVAIGRDGQIAWAGARFAELLDAASADLLAGASLDDFLDIGAGRSSREALGGEIEASTPAGRRVVLRAFEGDFGVLWLLEDTSDSECSLRDLREANRRLDEAERELKELRDRLEGDCERRERLLQVVSHELRTPVTVISGYSRLLLAEDTAALNDRQRHFLDQTSEGCRRLDALMANLLDASAARGVDATPRIRSDDLSASVRAVTTFLAPVVEERCVSLDVSVCEAASEARFDRGRIGQVLTNLLSNALRYARGSVRVSTLVSMHDGRRWVEVAVEDDGPGIPADRRGRIFEPYVRGVGEDDAGGLGLGLAISRRIVEAHQGIIEVGESDLGGSRFAFAWPADVALDEDAAREPVPRLGSE